MRVYIRLREFLCNWKKPSTNRIFYQNHPHKMQVILRMLILPSCNLGLKKNYQEPTKVHVELTWSHFFKADRHLYLSCMETLKKTVIETYVYYNEKIGQSVGTLNRCQWSPTAAAVLYWSAPQANFNRSPTLIGKKRAAVSYVQMNRLNRSSSWLQENYRSFYPNLIKENQPEDVSMHVTGCTCKHSDLNRWLCARISPITGHQLDRKEEDNSITLLLLTH